MDTEQYKAKNQHVVNMTQPEVWTIYKKVEISCSHQITASGYEGKCKNLHGHNYIVEIWMSSHSLNKFGMVYDFTEIKKVCDLLDHHHLNDVMQTDAPTAENIARWIHFALISSYEDNIIARVRVRETELSTSYAEYM